MATLQHHAALGSPFALMFPEAVGEILQRAEKMALPRKRFSPLSKGSPLTQRQAALDIEEEDVELSAEELDAFDAIADSGHSAPVLRAEDEEEDF